MQNRSVESGVQLFSRVKSQNAENLNGINLKLFPDGGPLRNQAIEVVFDQEIGYDDFYIDLIIGAVLPTKLYKEFKEVQVVLLNSEFHINPLKIIKILEIKLETLNIKNEKESIIENALKNLIILNCFSPQQFEVTCYNLERVIRNCKNPGFVLLDNILSQYWCAKFNNFSLSFDEHYKKTLNLLYDKIKDLNVVLIYGRPGIDECSVKGTQVSYIIELAKREAHFLATVKNLENHTDIAVPFCINVCLEFT